MARTGPAHAPTGFKPPSPDDVQMFSELELRQSASILAVQSRVLEKVASDAALEESLESLCVLIEGQIEGSMCSTLLLRGGRLRLGPGPNLPAKYAEGLDGLVPGECVGSCGTAVFRREVVIVSNIDTSPLWEDFRDFAMDHGIRACWSIPFFDRKGEASGTFAISHRRPREPSQLHLMFLETAGHLAGIAIERDRAETEKKLLETQLMHRQKLESLGQMAGGIAHDFNNLLTVITGNLSLAMSDSVQPTLARRLAAAAAAADNAKELTTQLLTYAGIATVELAEVDVAHLIRETELAHLDLVPKSTVLDTEIDNSVDRVHGDAAQIRRLIANLVGNALEAVADAGGRVGVSLAMEVVETGSPVSDYMGIEVAAGRYLVLTVTDNGVGIEPLALPKIADPFFSSKRSGRGLGLAIVLGAVKAHSAHFLVDSTLGRGTTFRVLFPKERLIRRATNETPAAASAMQSRDGHRALTVLVIEDEEAIRGLIRDVLETAGHVVLEAVDGQHGDEVWSQFHDRIDIVLLDRIMPRLSGDQLLVRRREQGDSTPVVVTSGFGGEVSLGEVMAFGADAVLSKPFDFVRLTEVLERTAEVRRTGPRAASRYAVGSPSD